MSFQAFRSFKLIPVLLSLAHLADGNEPPRILELSTRGIPLNGSISFLDANGTIQGLPVTVGGERFFWTQVPQNAVKATITSLTETSAPVILATAGNTFIAVNPTQPINPASVQQPQLTRLPLIDSSKTVQQVPPGSSGWVYVGGLEQDDSNSGWKSLYVLNFSDHAKPDKHVSLTYDKFLSRIIAGSDTRFIADFPLNLRPTPGNSSPNCPIVRAGQLMKMTELKRDKTSVFGFMTIE